MSTGAWSLTSSAIVRLSGSEQKTDLHLKHLLALWILSGTRLLAGSHHMVAILSRSKWFKNTMGCQASSVVSVTFILLMALGCTVRN
jgi:hypothetical protein